MAKMTMTEAMAEIPTLKKRIQGEMEFVFKNLGRNEKLRDPLEKDGGAPVVLASKRQAITDLQRRMLNLRIAVQVASHQTKLEVDGKTMTIAEWLTWRKEIAPQEKELLNSVTSAIDKLKRDIQSGAARGTITGSVQTDPVNVILHVDELEVRSAQDRLERILGILDGRLSLINATTVVEIPD